MRRARSVWVACAVVVALASCGTAEPPPFEDPLAGVRTDGAVAGSTLVADPATVTIWADERIAPAVQQLVATYSTARETTGFEVQAGKIDALLERVNSGERPNLLVGRSGDLAELRNNVVADRQRRLLGVDPMVVVVAPGNPEGIADLAPFGDSPLRAGTCAAPEPCAAAGRNALTRAGVAPAADREASSAELVDAVAAGELDAALVHRSNVGSRAGTVEVVPVPGNEPTKWEVALVSRTLKTDGFVDWFKSNDEAKRVLTSFGLARDTETGS